MSYPRSNVNHMKSNSAGQVSPTRTTVRETGVQGSAPGLPHRLQWLSDAPELVAVWDHQVAARSAEAQVLSRLLDYRKKIAAQVAGEHLFHRSAADKAAIHDAAQLLGVADPTAAAILNAAGFIREELPKTWEAFTSGMVDLARVPKIAVATVMLPADRDDLLATLDAEVSQIAVEKTAAELKHWLTRRIPELDVEAYQQRAEEALARRYVRIEHNDDGTSYLQALLPTPEAAVIEKRLKKVATSMHIPQPADTGHSTQEAPATEPPVVLTSTDPDDAPTAAAHDAGLDSGGDGRTRTQREADRSRPGCAPAPLMAPRWRRKSAYSSPKTAPTTTHPPPKSVTG